MALSDPSIFRCLRWLNRVVQQDRSCHWSDASWHRRDPGYLWLYLLEPHVPDEATAFSTVNAYVHDDRSLPDILLSHELTLACCDNEKFRPTSYLRQVLRARVADSNGRVLAQKKLGQRLADEVGASDHYGFLSRKPDIVTLQELDDATP